ncbi:MAG: CoA transferase [Chloroflexi bacterium]|nr:CoA transferase [Chloroflexota bacterium]MCY3685073.1 CoA transferase [Chloroflexota bacterium]MDE2707727.1 CoA transferase [Chloroflexota bacterium]
MLSDYRILDLTDDRGLIGGMILADLGADVIAIEPPGGNRARRRGPFADGSNEGDIEDSLVWQSYARGKRSLVLDLETDEGRARLIDLARSADALIESADVGAMDALGLGYEALSAVNPGLIYVAITPFGSSGPKAGWAATDITVAASAGPMIQSGDRDRPPLRVGLPQTALHAGAEAALGVLMGLHERKRSGLGQYVDVSAQAAYAQATQSGIIAAANNSGQFQRSAVGAALGPLEIRLFWPCKDGHVAITYLFGAAIGPFTDRLMQYALEEGYCDQETRDKDWLNYTNLILTGQEPISEYFRCCDVVGALCADKTKAELFQVAQERRLLIVPVSTMDDLDENEHLAARSYWRDVERNGQSVKFPGPFARLSETPIEYARPAPALGEHTDEVLAEARQPAVLNRANAATPNLPPLSGLKMLDLMWVMAGPAGTRALCDFGVNTVRIESSTRIDTARTLQPFIDDEATQPEGSSMFHNMNAGKQMMTVDPANPEGRELILDLVRWADVITESFTPRAMRGWNLTWETIHEVNPRAIMMSSCLMGQNGPLAEFAGFGNLAAAFAGFTPLCGWPDRSPAGPFGAYTDYVAPRFASAALLAALHERDRTGQGQYIDVSQMEAAIHFLTPAFLQYRLTGEKWLADGNNDPDMSPHGVFPSEGEDQWVAIACRHDADRASLDSVLNGQALEDWTASRPAVDAMNTLQAVGVPAHAVQDSAACFADPQLQHRNHFVELTHPTQGKSVVEGARVVFDRTPAGRPQVAPTMGADNDSVLRDLLGYSDEQIVELVASGALQ